MDVTTVTSTSMYCTPLAFEKRPARHGRQRRAASSRYSPGRHWRMLTSMGGEGEAVPEEKETEACVPGIATRPSCGSCATPG